MCVCMCKFWWMHIFTPHSMLLQHTNIHITHKHTFLHTHKTHTHTLSHTHNHIPLTLPASRRASSALLRCSSSSSANAFTRWGVLRSCVCVCVCIRESEGKSVCERDKERKCFIFHLIHYTTHTHTPGFCAISAAAGGS
jgi:hypothetical protein